MTQREEETKWMNLKSACWMNDVDDDNDNDEDDDDDEEMPFCGHVEQI